MIRHLSHFIFVFTWIAFFPFSLLADFYYTGGHGDLGLGDGDALELHLHCHAGAMVDGVLLAADQEFNPADAVIVVPESTKDYIHSQGGADPTVADNLGLGIGENYWFLPQSEIGAGGAAALHSPFLGIGAEDMNLGVFEGDIIDLTLLAMSGPAGGQVGMDQSGTWFMTTKDGISSDDKIEGFPVGGHDHFKWYFTKPGIYELTFEASATRNVILETDVNTYTFLVMPEPGGFALLATGICTCVGFLLFRKTRS